MDSLTQIVLGAAVGEVVLGRKVGNKAMLWGAIAGTIPDLDVYQGLIFDGLRASELHRGVSHSLLFSIFIAPVLAWLIKHKEKGFLIAILGIILGYPILSMDNISGRLIIGGIYAALAYVIYRSKFNSESASRKDWTKLAFWALVTHPLLDCHTTWGTQFLWPLPHRLAWNNIFVADPAYTIPFLIFVALAMFYRRESRTRRRLNAIGIAVSSLYMVWTLGVKWHVHTVFTKSLNEQHLLFSRLTTVPTPFNSILWSGTAESDSSYHVGLYSLLDKDQEIKFHEVEHDHHKLADLEDEDVVKRVKFLAKEWYVVTKDSNDLVMYDARYGPMFTSLDGEPKYAFGYRLVNKEGEWVAESVEPKDLKMDGMFDALIKRIQGE